LEFYWFNLKLGLGTDYTRYLEYPKVLEFLEIPSQTSQTLLDVGSGRRGQFPLFLAHKFRQLTVYSTDPREDFMEQMRLVKKLGLEEDVQSKRLRLQQVDVLAPAFDGERFDRISCISTIEHIPGNQDTKAIQNMAKLLKPNGLLVLSIPFNTYRYADVYQRSRAYAVPGKAENGNRHFFERIYDPQTLQERLISPSGLTLEKQYYFGEPGFSLGRWMHRGAKGKDLVARIVFKSYLLHLLIPFLSPLFLKEIAPDSYDTEDWSGVGTILRLRKSN